MRAARQYALWYEQALQRSDELRIAHAHKTRRRLLKFCIPEWRFQRDLKLALELSKSSELCQIVQEEEGEEGEEGE